MSHSGNLIYIFSVFLLYLGMGYSPLIHWWSLMPYLQCVCICVYIVGVLKVFRWRETWLTKENKSLKNEKDVCGTSCFQMHIYLHIYTCTDTYIQNQQQCKLGLKIVSQQWKSLLGFVQKEFFSYSFIYCLLMLSYYCSHS